jgi:hypothetical protein
MSPHTVINAAVNATRQQRQSRDAPDPWTSTNIPHLRQIEEERAVHERQTSYGDTSSSSTYPLDTSSRLGSPRKEPEIDNGEGSEDGRYLEVEEFEPVIDGMSTSLP